ncbi:peptide cleavage/export ABC transporter [Companilactobacillus crustorum]|uniref:peptide cleavage/export ABC transporter n=1 Tax=Companilactobacillus crustorum TaxID=392416 RepID=UPI000957A887|nr:peptide cleavage/export ABC transporter [Companilactobacillus crustorum]APU71881.1 Pediocin PA-1 transport/processing ATP-binding protein PedD [Companilactobacillus crustorum]
MTHYYTIFGISNNKLIIGDPNPNKAIEYMDLNTFQKEWSGIVIFLNPTDKYRIKVEKKNTLFQFIPIILSQIKLICLTILAAIIVTAISILGSYFVQHIVDDYIPNAKNSVMTIIAISLLFAYIIQAIMSFIQQYLSAKFGQRLKNIISFNYLKHVFKLPLSFFYTRKIGEITSRLNDANNVIDTLASAILSVFLDIWIVLIVSIFLVIQNFQLFLMTMLIMPIYTLIIYIFNKPFQKINHEMMENDSKLGSTVIEGLNEIETVKSLNSEGKLLDRIKKELSNYLNSDLKYKRMDFLQQSLKRGLKQILSLLILWVGAIFVIRHNLSLGELFTFNILLTFFLNPLESIVNLQSKMQQAKVANIRLNEVTIVKTENSVVRNIHDKNKINGDIIVRGINYKYGFGKNCLNNVNCQFKQGKSVAIIGMSGSGKTTLAKLLVGFIEPNPNSGTILFNNNDINDINRNTLREYINYVSQESFMLANTVYENLKFGNRPNITDKNIREACKIADIDEDIMSFPMGYDTYLSENGSILSGGQKQRLAIARALLSPAKILILDESTSNLDVITEQKIIQNLLNW